MVRQKRTDGRIAFENIPATFRPAGTFEVKVLDEKDNPLKGLKFSVIVDDGDERSFATDDAGVIKIRRPNSELRIKLTDT